MLRKITGFHIDEENHWVAELDCGHGQHVRHDPPWMERFWVLTEEGRRSRLGHEVNCVKCDELAQGGSPSGSTLPDSGGRSGAKDH
jgi:hypothetical protein